MDDEEIKKILWISGLKNAIEFGGKTNKKAIMGKLMAQRKDLRSQAKTVIPILDQIIEEISKLSIEEQKGKLLQLDPKALEKKEKIEEKVPQLSNEDRKKLSELNEKIQAFLSSPKIRYWIKDKKTEKITEELNKFVNK